MSRFAPVSTDRGVLPSQIPSFGISRIELPGRCNTRAKKQRQSRRMHRTSKKKGKKPESKESQAVSYEDRIQREQELLRNVPQPCDLADFGIFIAEPVDLSTLGLGI